MEDDAPLSLTEKLGIVSDFILSSPPGELSEVLNDCRVLLEDDDMLNNLSETIHQYFRDQFVTLEVEGRAVILSKYNHLEGTYTDPQSGKTFGVDVVKQVATNIVKSSTIPSESCKKLQALVNEYVLGHYPDGVVNVFQMEELLTTVIVDNKFSLGNFWTGKWRSVWTYEEGSSELKGMIKVNVHYFEDANVQLNNVKEITIKMDVGQNFSILPQLIKKAESDFQLALNEAYGTLSDLFKSLRRGLPITKTKMHWEAVGAYRLGSELVGSTNK